jgi:uncharacterized protein (TIGR03437 family)
MIQIILKNLSLLLGFALISLAQSDQPVVFGPVRNGASFEGFVPTESGPMPLGTGLAGGSIFVLFGSRLGPEELVLGSAPYPDQLPADAGGTRVTFRSLVDDRVYTAPLIHSLQNQVSGIVPSPLPVGFAEVTVAYDGMESEPTKVAIVEFSPGLFTVSQTGRGPAVVQNYESEASQPLNTLTRPAAPGQYIVLWGTGLGAIEGPDNAAPPAGNVRDDVSVRIGDVEIPAEYAGRSPEFPGVDQINVRIPDDGSIELGCYQDLGIQIGNHGFGSQVSISISDTPGECEHPWGLSAEQLVELESGGEMTWLSATLSDDFSVVQAARLDAYGVSQNRSSGIFAAVISPSPWFPGVCLQGSVFSVPPVTAPEPLPITRSRPGTAELSMGDSVELAGPGGRSFSLPKMGLDFGPVTDLGADAFVEGEWTLSATGGDDLGAFSSPFSVRGLPDLILPANVQLGVALEIEWDGSAYQEGERITISLTQNPAEPPQAGLKTVRCRVDATRGSIEMTAQNLAWLGVGPGAPLLWEISVESAAQAIEAEGLDYGRLTTLISKQIEATAAQ